jgi:dTDP-4-dehydrorhamnose reductase
MRYVQKTSMLLLLGASGYVGRCFEDFFQREGVKVLSVSRAHTDYTAPHILQRLLKETRPDFLVNAAGFTGKPNVDACEKARAETLLGNTVLPLSIAEACGEHGIPWGHVSSGCIYQGSKGTDPAGNPPGFREEDTPNFSFASGTCSFYSGTKAMAEEYLMKGPSNIYIWRLRIPFDHRDGSRNYLSKLLRYERLLNVRNSLSHLGDFVSSAWATMQRRLPYGTYNLTNSGSVTTSEVVDLIRHEGIARLATKDLFSSQRMLRDFLYFESEEEFMKTGAVADRSSCVLDTTKAKGFDLPMRPVREALIDSLQRWIWETT